MSFIGRRRSFWLPWVVMGLTGLAAGVLIYIALSKWASTVSDFSIIARGDWPKIASAGETLNLTAAVEPPDARDRVQIRWDGHPVHVHWVDAERGLFRVLPQNRDTGFHVLSFQSLYMGGRTRSAAFPVTIGPLTEAEDWLEEAVFAFIPEKLIDAEAPNKKDMASTLEKSIEQAIPSRLPPDYADLIRSLDALPPRIELGDDELKFFNRIIFNKDSSVDLSAAIRFELDEKNELLVIARGLRADVDVSGRTSEDVRELASEEASEKGKEYGAFAGRVGEAIGAFIGSIAGMVVAEEEIEQRIGEKITALVRAEVLPQLSDALAMNEPLTAGDMGIELQLRYARPPKIRAESGISVVFDVRAKKTAAFQSKREPFGVPLSGVSVARPWFRDRAGITLSIDFVNTLLARLWESGSLDEQLVATGGLQNVNTELANLGMRIDELRFERPPVMGLQKGDISGVLSAEVKELASSRARSAETTFVTASKFVTQNSQIELQLGFRRMYVYCRRETLVEPCYPELVDLARQQGPLKSGFSVDLAQRLSQIAERPLYRYPSGEEAMRVVPKASSFVAGSVAIELEPVWPGRD